MTDDERAKLDALLAHELRSPIAAILGYHELLADGVLGPIENRAREAIDRIARAARQLRALADGFDALTTGVPAPTPDEIQETDAAALLRSVGADAAHDAALRDASLDVRADPGPPLRTHPGRLGRVLELILMAAIRRASGRPLVASCNVDARGATFEVTGSTLDPSDADRMADGASLRIGMARRLAASLDAQVVLPEPGRILVRVRGLRGSD